MSSTRKIEVFVHDVDAPLDIAYNDMGGRYPMRSTLIIGGKAYTEEEHEAEFQRRAKAMMNDVRDKLASGWIHPDEITTIAASHGIQLP